MQLIKGSQGGNYRLLKNVRIWIVDIKSYNLTDKSKNNQYCVIFWENKQKTSLVIEFKSIVIVNYSVGVSSQLMCTNIVNKKLTKPKNQFIQKKQTWFTWWFFVNIIRLSKIWVLPLAKGDIVWIRSWP